ncbi:MAG: hypothetical protein H0T62_09890 [Parachlamydiaceae bacterium]|nr:hypothetical protein [Parachlamydiaceae bacterium]
MGSGALSKSAFESYIQQDYLFLLDRIQAFSILAERAPNPELQNYLQDLAYKSKIGADEIFYKNGFIKPDSEKLQKTPACKRYTDEMLMTA